MPCLSFRSNWVANNHYLSWNYAWTIRTSLYCCNYWRLHPRMFVLRLKSLNEPWVIWIFIYRPISKKTKFKVKWEQCWHLSPKEVKASSLIYHQWRFWVKEANFFVYLYRILLLIKYGDFFIKIDCFWKYYESHNYTEDQN